MAKKKVEKQLYLGNQSLPTPEAAFDYAEHPEWVADIEKCRTDIVYFAENFFYIVNLDRGKIKIELHDYQRRILKALRDHRFVVTLSSRQSGKALAIDTPILTSTGWSTMGELQTGDEVYSTTGKLCNVVKAHEILYNRPCYEVGFDNGEKIIADADHLWFTQSWDERVSGSSGSVKTTAQLLQALEGKTTGFNCNHRIRASAKTPDREWYYIRSVTAVPSVPVRCITVDSDDSLYLCGRGCIPTHNTTMMTIYALWIACFVTDQRILIVANKEATAISIFKRVRLAYEQLPNYLKPGVVEYGKTAMALGNGSSIGISTTSSDAGRGESCNCVTGDSMLQLRDKTTGVEFQMSMSDLSDILEKTGGELPLIVVNEV